jgi:cation diffusion facilitator family transporter
MDNIEAGHAKRLAALMSVGTALVLVSLKIFLSVWTGSLSVLSEALHSGLDLVAAVITCLSVRVSDKPADADHPYGHAKYESFSAFVETGLLLLTAVYIIVEAFLRLIHGMRQGGMSPMRPSLLAVALLGVMLILDLLRARKLQSVARKYPSEALEADALHFSTDVWSTSVVLVGMAAVWVGQHFGIGWLAYIDPLAALAVAGVIVWVGSRLGRRTLDALVDVAPIELQARVKEAVGGVEGVLSTERVRMRRAGNRYFVDVTITLPRTASLEQAHATSTAVEQRIGNIVPADVMVHMEPRAGANEPFFETIRATAQRRGLAIHELSAHHYGRALVVDLHLEVDEKSSLREAHRIATGLEEEIYQLAAGDVRVNIHIEPMGSRIGDAEEIRDLGFAVQEFINSLLNEFHELKDCHEVHVRRAEHKIVVSGHCAMDGDLAITQVHDVTAALEDRVKEKFPQIFRVTIHPEPVEEI